MKVKELMKLLQTLDPNTEIKSINRGKFIWIHDGKQIKCLEVDKE